MDRICHILGAGVRHSAPFVPNPGDLVIAADGGYAYALALGLVPDLCVGDFDSLGMPPNEDAILLPTEKDDTDMLAAIRLGASRGYRTFHIHGGTGGRFDHTLANIQCIASLAQRGMRGYLHDEGTIITAICGDCIRFPAHAKGTISVFAHSDEALGVDEIGLKYALQNATLRNSFPIGISNEFVGCESLIRVQSGVLIIIYPCTV